MTHKTHPLCPRISDPVGSKAQEADGVPYVSFRLPASREPRIADRLAHLVGVQRGNWWPGPLSKPVPRWGGDDQPFPPVHLLEKPPPLGREWGADMPEETHLETPGERKEGIWEVLTLSYVASD